MMVRSCPGKWQSATRKDMQQELLEYANDDAVGLIKPQKVLHEVEQVYGDDGLLLSTDVRSAERGLAAQSAQIGFVVLGRFRGNVSNLLPKLADLGDCWC